MTFYITAAGSLLEFAFGEISIPVGRVQNMQIYPMTFYEYLNGVRRESLARESLEHPSTVNEHVQNILLQKYSSCPRGLVLHDGIYKNLPEQKLEYWPLYSAGGMSGERISDIYRDVGVYSNDNMKENLQ